MSGANALEEDVRKLQHQKKHSDARITEHPSMREATINYDEPIVASVESQNTTVNTVNLKRCRGERNFYKSRNDNNNFKRNF